MPRCREDDSLTPRARLEPASALPRWPDFSEATRPVLAAGTGLAFDHPHARARSLVMIRIPPSVIRSAASGLASTRRHLFRVGTATRTRRRSAFRALRVAAAVMLVAASATAGGVGVWAGVTAAGLDLEAAQRTPLVFAAGRVLKPGLAIQAVDESLDRLGYREVSGGPTQPGEFRRTRATREIYLRAHEDVAAPA